MHVAPCTEPPKKTGAAKAEAPPSEDSGSVDEEDGEDEVVATQDAAGSSSDPLPPPSQNQPVSRLLEVEVPSAMPPASGARRAIELGTRSHDALLRSHAPSLVLAAMPPPAPEVEQPEEEQQPEQPTNAIIYQKLLEIEARLNRLEELAEEAKADREAARAEAESCADGAIGGGQEEEEEEQE